MTKETIKSYHLETIFANMCRVAGANYHKIDRASEDWYMEHSWDESTSEEFTDWMADYIHKIPAAQRELYERSHMSKKQCVQAAHLFILSYGWHTTRDKSKDNEALSESA